MQDHGMVVWLTGLSGAGKSTLAQAAAEVLRAQGRRVEVLDGDVLRETLSRGLGYSRSDRETQVRRIAYVAELLARNAVVAIVAAISPYRESRARARALCSRFVEVHVAASLTTCIQRDPKGLYARALRGEIANFTGVSDPYEEPLDPELRIDTAAESIEDATLRLLAAIGEPMPAPRRSALFNAGGSSGAPSGDTPSE